MDGGTEDHKEHDMKHVQSNIVHINAHNAEHSRQGHTEHNDMAVSSDLNTKHYTEHNTSHGTKLKQEDNKQQNAEQNSKHNTEHNIEHGNELSLETHISPRSPAMPQISTPSGSPGSSWGSRSPSRRVHCSMDELLQHCSPQESLQHSSGTKSPKHGSLEELLSSSPPAYKARLLRLPSHVSRDATQPSRGDLSASSDQVDIEGSEDQFSEFPLSPLPRPHSSTCPESRAWKRRQEMKVRRRPASPPACPVEVTLLSQQLASMALKQHLHIPDRVLPELSETDKTD